MTDSPARQRLRSRAASSYDPAEHAEHLLDLLERMEVLSDARPAFQRYRATTGLTCAAEFRRLATKGQTEDAITGWLAELCPNAEAQVTDLVRGPRPDVCFGFARDARGADVVVVLEAKPIWQRWITTGGHAYSNVTTDGFGRSTGNYAARNIAQLVSDRDKLLRTYRDPRDRHLLLALVFQRRGELDERIVKAVGSGWDVRRRHVLDRCNPPGDDIGMTGMIFWPSP